MKIETNCPNCGKPGEVEEAILGQWMECPYCKEQVVPGATQLQILRSKTHYPELRAMIQIVRLLVATLGIILGLVSILTGFGTGGVLVGVVTLIFIAIWLKVFQPLASLTIDAVDALIEVSRRP